MVNPVNQSFQNPSKVIKSDMENRHEQSFSFDNSEVLNKTIQEQKVSLNKENYISYDKKVKAFQDVRSGEKNGLIRPMVISPPPNVSMNSFKNMTSYVKNTFRKNKPSGRKNSYYSYSSHRRKEPMSSMSKYVSNSKNCRKKGKTTFVIFLDDLANFDET